MIDSGINLNLLLTKKDKIIMNENQDCASCNLMAELASGGVVGGYIPEGETNFVYNDADANALRDTLKVLFDSSWTGIPDSLFDDGAMTYEVKLIVDTYILNWMKCHALVNALTTVTQFINPGTAANALVSACAALISEVVGLVIPIVGLAGIRYTACRLAALNGIKTDLIMAMSYVG